MKIGIGPAIAGKLTSQVTMVAILATATVGGVSLVSSSVFASLNATAYNATAQNVNGGALTLSLSAVGNSITGVTTTDIAKIVPGDIQYRYVDLNQQSAGSDGVAADGTTTTLKIDDSVIDANSLLDANLTVKVDECYGATWSTPSLTPTASSTCTGGTIAPVLAATSVASLATAASITLHSVAAGTSSHLRITFSIPSVYSETSANGVVPTSTIQSKAAALKFTFAEAQLAGSTTNS